MEQQVVSDCKLGGRGLLGGEAAIFAAKNRRNGEIPVPVKHMHTGESSEVLAMPGRKPSLPMVLQSDMALPGGGTAWDAPGPIHSAIPGLCLGVRANGNGRRGGVMWVERLSPRARARPRHTNR